MATMEEIGGIVASHVDATKEEIEVCLGVLDKLEKVCDIETGDPEVIIADMGRRVELTEKQKTGIRDGFIKPYKYDAGDKKSINLVSIQARGIQRILGMGV